MYVLLTVERSFRPKTGYVGKQPFYDDPCQCWSCKLGGKIWDSGVQPQDLKISASTVSLYLKTEQE